MNRDKERALDLRVYEGRTVQLRLRHIIRGGQYAVLDLDDGLSVSGWLPGIAGEPDGVAERTIREMFLVQHSNGGRGYSGRAKSYAEYFNDTVKARVLAQRAGGLLGRMLSRGDADRADILVYFTDGTMIDSMQYIECPDEWYSEQFADRGALMLERGFYPDAVEALAAQHRSDDLFGERYFPVAAFPDTVSQHDIDECIWRPKVTADPIRVGGYVIYGTRCKSQEVAEFIEAVYQHGGAIIRGTQWDW